MQRRPRGAAVMVAAGILLSKLAGLVNRGISASYFGTTATADAFNAAFRIPNLLQNLFGDGVLSASFIPVYARLLAEEKHEEADRVAGAVFAILAALMSVLVLIGVLATPLMVYLINPGFEGAKRELTIRLVRIIFPGTGILVMSAWCLGMLNSHRRFFISYSASVLWNAAQIAALVGFGRSVNLENLAVAVAWASVVGSALQFFAQLPVVLRLAPALKIAFATQMESVRTVVRNFGPVLVSRGVVQISAYIDQIFASELPDGAFSGLTYANTLYLLPVSLFGMAISASELPEMSRALGHEEEIATQLRTRLVNGLRRIAFFVIPSVVAFVALGDQVAGAVYHGRFTHGDALYVWGILAGSGVGLLASTQGRLYSSAFYALKDTRTPLRFAVIRIALTTVLGYLCAFPLPQLLGIDARWGVAGLTASAGVSGWIEFLLLRRALSRRIGSEPVGLGYLTRLWTTAAVAAGVAWGIKLSWSGAHRPIVLAAATLIPFGCIYLAFADPKQIKQVLGRLTRTRR